jgi:ferredoxin
MNTDDDTCIMVPLTCGAHCHSAIRYLRERLRETSQILITEVGADGLMDAEDAARAIVAMVERLRAEAADLRMQLDERLLDNQHAYDDGFRNGESDGLTDERAAVVAWLLLPGTSCDNAVLAEAIERGEHRREEEP